jgi:hypothetical protein
MFVGTDEIPMLKTKMFGKIFHKETPANLLYR